MNTSSDNGMRQAEFERMTDETNIHAAVNLDGSGDADIQTKAGFFNHMIEQLACHSLIDITLKGSGDEHIDFHHLVEDCGYAIGYAISRALGNRQGIARYGSGYAPMDESLARAVIDFSGRPALIYHVTFDAPKIADFDVELFREFLHAFAQGASAALHLELFYGINNHHRVEAVFKALALSLRQAVCRDVRKKDIIPSTKGSLSGVQGKG